MPKHISEYFTLPGKILALLTLVLAVGGPWVYFAMVMDELPPGSYPILFFALPVMIGAVFFFAFGAMILKYFGIAVFKKDDR